MQILIDVPVIGEDDLVPDGLHICDGQLFLRYYQEGLGGPVLVEIPQDYIDLGDSSHLIYLKNADTQVEENVRKSVSPAEPDNPNPCALLDPNFVLKLAAIIQKPELALTLT